MVGLFNKVCAGEGCRKSPIYGEPGTRRGEFCHDRTEIGLVNLRRKRRKRRKHPECDKGGTFGPEGSRERIMCRDHHEAGMVILRKNNRECSSEGGDKRPSLRMKDSTVRACVDHAQPGMVRMHGRAPCIVKRCTTRPTFGVEGSTKPQFWHAKSGMVNNVSVRCSEEGCLRHANFGQVDVKRREFCSLNAREGMIQMDANSKRLSDETRDEKTKAKMEARRARAARKRSISSMEANEANAIVATQDEPPASFQEPGAIDKHV